MGQSRSREETCLVFKSQQNRNSIWLRTPDSLNKAFHTGLINICGIQGPKPQLNQVRDWEEPPEQAGRKAAGRLAAIKPY